MTTHHGKVYLRRGDSGEYVRQVQDRLVELGFAVDVQHNLEAHDTRHAHPAESHGHGTANSSEHENSQYGEHTTEAVQAFQAAYGLNVTGHIDEATWGLLFSDFEGGSIASDDPADRPTADRLIELCLHHVNDTYDLGTSADHHDPDVHLFDCAELISWACAQIGVPNIPSYSGGIWDACARAGHTMSPDTAAHVRGALLYRAPGGKHTYGHVALSLGTGRDTIEAMSSAHGIVVGNIGSRFTDAAYLPGIDYHN